jgi:hypothetical protein
MKPSMGSGISLHFLVGRNFESDHVAEIQTAKELQTEQQQLVCMFTSPQCPDLSSDAATNEHFHETIFLGFVGARLSLSTRSKAICSDQKQ